jgi:GT2 family glycosyltransferase
MGVQPIILRDTKKINRSSIVEKLENAIYKVLMLSYRDENKLNVRRSGVSVFSSAITKIITAQRLSGCCCCYRREVFYEFSFDTNLKKWGFMEDLDFSYRVHKKYPRSLYVIPHTTIIHKASKEARLPTKIIIDMSTIYWFYIFFKDIFEGSILNLIAFLWALAGNLIAHTGSLIIKRKSKREWWSLIYLFKSYITALKYLRNIIMQNLDFFNETLKKV